MQQRNAAQQEQERKSFRLIGITGGVGAGKSTVLKLLQDLYQIPVMEADAIGRELMEPDGACFPAVLSLFAGNNKNEKNPILLENGCLDRQKIAQLVFSAPEKLEALNGIIHPAVRSEILRRIESLKEQGRSCAVLESAILIECGYEQLCSEIWFVTADEEVRIHRLEESRGYSREKCLQIMQRQMSGEELARHADHVIYNDRDESFLKEQIAQLILL